MRLHILSDLHTEFLNGFKPLVRDADVTILAGDNQTECEWVRLWAQLFDGQILMVMGNHEYYGHHIESRLNAYRGEAIAFPGKVHLLERDAVVIDGIRFLGCTGWPDFTAGGDPELCVEESAFAIADFFRIRTNLKVPGESAQHATDMIMTPAKMAAMSRRDRTWLTEQLQTPFDGKTVVITHFPPAYACIDTPYHRKLHARNPLDGYFANAWDRPGPAGEPALLGEACELERPPLLWVYGHNHVSDRQQLGQTLTISNQFGYPREVHTRFDPKLVMGI